MSVETLLLKRRRALYTSDSSTVICTEQDFPHAPMHIDGLVLIMGRATEHS